MSCQRCKKRDVAIALEHLAMCKPCFLTIIEARARKHLRTHTPLTKDQRLLVLDDGSKEAIVSYHLLTKITAPMPNMQVDRSHEMREGYDRVFHPLSANKQAAQFLAHVLGQNQTFQPSVVGSLKDDELTAYAELKGLPYTEHQPDPFENAVQMLNQWYPNSVFGFIKSRDQLEGLRNSDKSTQE